MVTAGLTCGLLRRGLSVAGGGGEVHEWWRHLSEPLAWAQAWIPYGSFQYLIPWQIWVHQSDLFYIQYFNFSCVLVSDVHCVALGL